MIDKKLSQTQKPTPRLVPLDSLRGLIIILMALDHANHFIAHQHPSGEYYSGLPKYNNSFTGSLLFLTRFVTHLCAPGFFFLMGIGMVYFSTSRQDRGWSNLEIMRHFWIRGIILITLQIFVVNRIWELHPDGFFPWPYFGVLYALGGAMILGSFTLQLRIRSLVLLILPLILFTEFDSSGSIGFGPFERSDYQPLYDQSSLVLLFFIAGGNDTIWVNYPILAWMKVLIFGIIFGKMLIENPEQTYRRGMRIGVAFLGAFFILRILNGYGNSQPLPGNFSWIDFLNVVKYPPSITFVLLTLGINLLILYGLWLVPPNREKYLKPLVVFGQVALFVYILHLLLYAIIGNLLTPNGSELYEMYIIWVLGLLVLYPICFYYGKFKHSQPSNSIMRMF